MIAIEFPVDLIRDLGTVFGVALALVGLNAALRDVYRRTVGRRRDRYRRLARLGVGAQLGFFESVLGEPPAIRRTVAKKDFSEYLSSDDPRYQESADELQEVQCEKRFLECIFIDRDYFVQTISDDDASVLAFSVTTRSSRFRPTFQLPAKIGRRDRRQWKRQTGEAFTPLFRIRLGQTRFAELDRDGSDESGPHFRAWRGARSFSYAEDHYYGNPGYYQTFVFSMSSNTKVSDGARELGGAIEEAGGEEWPDTKRVDQLAWEEMPKTRAFRHKATITTYTVLGVDLWLKNYPSTFGPNGDEVRMLP